MKFHGWMLILSLGIVAWPGSVCRALDVPAVLWGEWGGPLEYVAQKDLEVHQRPDSRSALVEGVRVRRGDVLSGFNGRRSIVTPGTVQVLHATDLEAMNYGQIESLPEKAT